MKHFYLPKTLFFGLVLSLMISCQESPKEDNTVTISGDITEDSQWTADKKLYFKSTGDCSPWSHLNH